MPGELAVERRADLQVGVELGDVEAVRVAGEELGVAAPRSRVSWRATAAAAYGPGVANAAQAAAQIRIARPTDRLEEVVAFYRDGLGLEELGGFSDHDGYTGVMLGLPGPRAHLEFTSPRRRQPGRRPERATTCSSSTSATRSAATRPRLRSESSAERRWSPRTLTGRRSARSRSRTRTAGASRWCPGRGSDPGPGPKRRYGVP